MTTEAMRALDQLGELIDQLASNAREFDFDAANRMERDAAKALMTITAALTLPADGEVEAIRARHEADNGFESDGLDSAEWRASLTMLATRAHADRATLLAHVSRLSAELAAERERRVEVEGALDAYEAALDPNETKHAYMGEFKNENGSYVSWTTIKETMAAIKARAATLTKDTP